MEILAYSQEMFRIAAEGRTQGIWFFAAVYVLVVCLYSIWFQIRTRYWPATNGKFSQLGVKKFGATDCVKSDQDYIGDALYTYFVNGKQYEGVRISPWIIVASHNMRIFLRKQQDKIQIQPDGKVRVYYNPVNPNKSYLVVAGKTGIESWTPLIGQ